MAIGMFSSYDLGVDGVEPLAGTGVRALPSDVLDLERRCEGPLA